MNTKEKNGDNRAVNEKSLSTTVLKGGSWLGISALIQAGLQIIIFAILARLLTPTQFGLVAIASIFIDVATGIAPLGTGQALVQRRDLTEDHIRASVWISISSGIVIGAVLAMCGGPIATLLGTPDSAPLIAVLAAIFPIRALSFVPAGLAARAKNFRALAMRQLWAYVIGYGVIGISTAALGAGAWSLVYAQLSQALIATVLLIAVVRFPFSPTFSGSSYRDILSYGSGFSAARVLNSLATQVDRAIVSANSAAAAVGLYTRALQIVRYPTLLVGQVIEDVLFPSFSGVQTDDTRLKRAFTRSLGSITVVMLPIASFVCIGAGLISDVLLGPQWHGVVPLIVVFGASLPFRSSQRICSAALRAVGRSWLVASLQLLLLVATILGSWFGIQYGLVGAAIGVTIAFMIHYLALLIFCAIELRVSGGPILVHHLSGIPLGLLVAGGTAAVVVAGSTWSPFVALPVSMAVAAIMAGLGAWFWPSVILGADGKWLASLLGSKLPKRIKAFRPVSSFLVRVSA